MITKYNIGACINGFELVDRFTEDHKSKGVFICPHCGEWFETLIGHIVSGNTKSCGCSRKGLNMGNSFAQGGRGNPLGNPTHRLSSSKIHSIWSQMKVRCYNTSSLNYSQYGARGIRVYPLWIRDFKAFYDYVTKLESYPGEDGLGQGGLLKSLDRIDNNGNYEPGNLRWATQSTQLKNRGYATV